VIGERETRNSQLAKSKSAGRRWGAVTTAAFAGARYLICRRQQRRPIQQMTEVSEEQLVLVFLGTAAVRI